MKNFEEMSREELTKALDKQINNRFKEKATLKELTTYITKDQDTLFIIPNGFLIGKPYIGDEPMFSGYIIVNDVILFDSFVPEIKQTDFGNIVFQLAIDQIIAFTTIDRKVLFEQLESQHGYQQHF